MIPIDVVIPGPPEYIHVEAFREVATTVHDGLQKLGFDSKLYFHSFNMVTKTRRSLILGGHLLSIFGGWVPEDSIIYNLEYIPEPNGFDEGRPETPDKWKLCMGGRPAYIGVLKKAGLILDYSKHNARNIRHYGVTAPVRTLPMGYSDTLLKIPFAPEKDIDVLFIGSISPRRQAIIDTIKAKGYNAIACFGVYGKERDALLSRAKICLSAHYYESNLFEQVRISYYLANGLFVISEDSSCPHEDETWSEGVVIVPYAELANTCIHWLKNWDSLHRERAQITQNGMAFMRRRTMEDMLKGVLGEYL